MNISHFGRFELLCKKCQSSSIIDVEKQRSEIVLGQVVDNYLGILVL
jgi:hypothetical protein